MVVRELENEVEAHKRTKELRVHLRNLEVIRREAHRGLDSTCNEAPDVKTINEAIRATHAKIDSEFNKYTKKQASFLILS